MTATIDQVLARWATAERTGDAAELDARLELDEVSTHVHGDTVIVVGPPLRSPR
jgi:hypothetical protein